MQIAKRVRHAVLVLLGSYPAFALAQAYGLADCANIPDDAKRLQCFDELAAGNLGGAARKQPGTIRPEESLQHPSPTASSDAVPAPRTEASDTFLAQHWELAPENKQGTFIFRPHQPNYLIATYTNSPNVEPYRPFRRFIDDSLQLSHAELAFQLGFKMKLMENAFNKPADLWFGYTQNSFWQAGNQEASSPFRESNYQPEFMAVIPTDFSLLGMRTRFVNLGLVHQSNGQASSLSRSWNRIYAQLGMERGDFSLLARIWKRLHESSDDDDNPDIVDYLGRGDLYGTYRWNGHEFSMLARYNFQTRKGAAQLGWAFPLTGKLKGYLQLFSGYGQSLIDYNHSMNVLGLGVWVNY